MIERPVVSIAVTGIGAFSSIGKDADEMSANLRAGNSGIGLISLFDTAGLKIKHAAEIPDYNPNQYFTAGQLATLDRTSQFAQIAAKQAIADSGLDFDALNKDRIALVSGVCSGTYDGPQDASLTDSDLARRTVLRVRHYQNAMLAKELDIHGLQASVSTACASSSTALAYAYEILQSDRADYVLVGGADGLLFVTYAGFYALGAMAERPCSPFSTGVGVSFGEGSGFVVLEKLSSARQRGAKIYGELAGYGSTGDAYHYTSPHPSGEGLRRAMEAALRRSHATVDDIDYINAHGTGTRDNDTAESLAITDLCAGKRTPPPVSSTKSFTGHTLGAAGILEFITCLLAARDEFVPPTANFEAARPGCDLDYVPNKARAGSVDFFLSSSAAFGGVNTVVAGRRVPNLTSRTRRVPRIAITGIGVVSPAGCGVAAFRQSLTRGPVPFPSVDRFNVSDCAAKTAALVRDFKPRQLTPSIDVRRLDLINQFASVSASLAYSDACLTTQPADPERIGAVMALAAGPVGTHEAFQKNLAEKGVEGVSAKFFPAIVISTLGGQVCQTLNLKGLNSTICDGVGAGLHGFAHAYEMLRGSDRENQIILVAPDELCHWLFRNMDLAGVLADDMRPYHPDSRGSVAAEGSFALVLERLDVAQARGARIYAEVLGYGASCGTTNVFDETVSSEWLAKSMSCALRDATAEPREIDFAVGIGHGRPAYDNAEKEALRTVLGESAPVSLPARLLGLGVSGCGAAALTLGALGLHDQTVYLSQSQSKPASLRKSLVFGGSEHGNCAAFVLGVPQ